MVLTPTTPETANNRRADDAGSDHLKRSRLRDEQMANFRQMLPLMGGVQILIGTLTALAYYQAVSPLLLGGWLGLIWLSGLVSLWSWLRNRKRRVQIGVPLKAMRRASWSAIFMGSVWGAGVFLFFPDNDLAGQTLMAFVVGGMTAGSMAALWSLPTVGIAFTSFAVLPLIVRLLMAGEQIHVLMAIMAGIYFIALAVISRIAYVKFVDGVAVKSHLSSIVESVNQLEIGLVVYDSDERLVFVNERKNEMYADSARIERQGAKLTDVVRARRAAGHYPDAEGREDDWEAEYLARLRTGDYQRDLQMPDGNWVQTGFRRTASGGYVGTRIDITERKQTEESLRKLSRAVDQSPSMVMITDVGGVIEYVNPKFSAVTGYGPDEALGKTPRFLKSGERSDDDYSVMWQTILEGRDWHGEFRNRNKDGTLIWVSASISPVAGDDGTVRHFVAIQDDISERKQAEQALADSQERFRDLADAASDWFWELDADLRFTYVSDRVMRFNGGVHPSTFYGMSRRELDIPAGESQEKWDRHYADMEARKPIKGFEYTFVDQHGELHHWSVSGRPKFDAAGKFIGYRGVGRDVTDRKVADEELRQSRAQYQAVVEGQSELVTRFAPDGEFTFANDAYCRFVGKSQAELLGTSIYDDVPDEEADALRAYFSNFTEGQQLQTNENALHRHDGVERIFEWTNSAFYDSDGELTGFQSVARDITERREAERELQSKTELIHLLGRTATDANHAADLTDAIKATLDDVCAYNGWPVGHAYLLSEDDPDLVVPSGIWHMDDAKRFATFRELTENTPFERGVGLPGRVLETGEPAWIVDVTKDKNFPRANLAQDIGVKAGFACPVLAGSKVVGVLEFFAPDAIEPDQTLLDSLVQVGTQLGRVHERDRSVRRLRKKEEQLTQQVVELKKREELLEKQATELVAFAEDLAETRDELELLDQQKNKFFSIIAHDLKNPFNSLLGFSRLMAKSGDKLSHQQLVDFGVSISEAAERLFGLLEDLLAWGRTQMDQVVFEPDTLDLGEVADAGTAVLTDVAREKCVTLTLEVPELYVSADREMLVTVLRNLVGNAIKFTEAGGEVTVAAEAKGEYVGVRVSDSGVGMNEEQIAGLFRIDTHTSTKGTGGEAGTGLGLLLCKEFLAKHHSELTVESAPGQGTTFRFSLPSAAAQAAE